MGSDNRRGVVQWVIPDRGQAAANNGNINRRRNTNQLSLSPPNSFDSERCANSFSNQNYALDHHQDNNRNIDHRAARQSESSNLNEAHHHHQEPATPNLIDVATCRTICVIIEQYLKELKEHQELINNARVKLIAQVPHPSNDENFTTHTDLSRLKVRSEQIKAIETIKQLTSYLRELTHIKNHMESLTNPADEDTYNKLSDIRSSIIQALNDFVLANSDIDFPILGADDPTNEYDLCIDAQRSRNDIRKMNVAQKFDAGGSASTDGLLADRTNVQLGDLVVSKNDELDAIKLAEQRGQEIQKLEKNTVELRRLFADFYELVKIQSEQVDTIEDNIVMAAQQISEGRNHLAQRPMRGLTVLVPVTGCITGALIGGPIGFIVGGKLGSMTIICASSLLGLLSSMGAHRCFSGDKSSGSTGVKVKYA
uniref:Syntaxin-17 n=1 Tax=Aceria tosichella TaxID=561515 RepID=A0A6G1SDH2_9ACAR